MADHDIFGSDFITDRDAIRSILDSFFNQEDPTGAGRLDQEYLDAEADRLDAAQDGNRFMDLVDDYEAGNISWEQLVSEENIPREMLAYSDEFAEYHDRMMSSFEAEEIISALETNPERLNDPVFERLSFPQTEQIISDSAFSFAGVTPTSPITTVGDRVVLRGGAGVTTTTEEILNAGGRVFGEGGILDAVVPYIPGISLPSWMPTAGVIFLPSIGEAIDKINTIVKDTDISSAIEEGNIGEILNDIGTIIVGAGEAATGEIQEQINKVLGQIQGAVADPTQAGTIIGGVLAGSFPSGIPDWLGGILAENVGSAVYGAARNVMVNSGTATESQLPPITQETPEQDPALMFTHRGDNVFVNQGVDEFFVLNKSEDINFDFNGEYTRDQLEDTGLEVVDSGSYQELVDTFSFYALEEDIYQYPMDVLIDRYEAEGGVLPDNWDTLAPNAQYDYLANAALVGEEVDITSDTTVDSDTTADDTTNISDLFEQELGQTEQNILDAIAQAGYATPEDITAALTEAGVLTAENLATTLAAAGFATVEDIGTALANAGFATPEDIATALAAAGFATPEDLVTALSNAGYATPEDLVTALSESGLATPEDIATALTNAGLATPQDIADAFTAAGLATPQDITDAIAAAGLATPQDVADALAEFGFTEEQLQQIVGVLPENLTVEQLNTALTEAISSLPTGTDLDTATTTITDAISGLSFATAEDVRTALAEFGFTEAQLEQIVNALPEGLSLSDLNTALEGVVVGEDLTVAVTTITDAISGLDIASPQDVRDALAEFNFSEAQLAQIINALPENITNNDLATALEGVVVGEDLDTAVTTITDAIGGLAFATPEDVRTALAEFGFTEAQLEQIVGALPEGLSIADLNTALENVVVGADLDTAVTTITNAISGLDIASPDDIRSILANYGFTEAQLQQIVGALPEGLSLSDVTTALDTALSGIALGTDLDTATTTITDAISGLAFATPDDVANALAQFGFSEDQLNQIAGVIPEGLTLDQLNEALSDAVSGIALGTDLNTATTTITDAIGGLSFATAQDVQDALTGFNFTENQLNQISNLLPDNLTQSQVQDLLNTALTGVSTQEDVDTAFETLTTNLNLSLGGLETGQEDILTGQEGLLGGQEQIRELIGEETQSLEDILIGATGLLGALGAGGGTAAPRPQPYQKYLEKVEYAPEKVQMVQQTPKVDYQKEVDRLLMFGRAPQQPSRKPGMLA